MAGDPLIGAGRPGDHRFAPLKRRPGGDDVVNVLVRTPAGVEEVREVDSDWIIPGDILSDGSVVLELWDELSDDDYLAIGLYD